MTGKKAPILDPADDAPDMSAPEWLAKARVAMALRKAGRPPKRAQDRKIVTTIRLDREIIESFRALGTGWQTKINKALGDWLAQNKR